MSDNISKIVFSRTLKNVGPTPLELKQSRNGGSKNNLAGSPGLIVTLMQLNLIDEYQPGVHPIITGSGLHYLKTSRIKLILNS